MLPYCHSKLDQLSSPSARWHLCKSLKEDPYRDTRPRKAQSIRVKVYILSKLIIWTSIFAPQMENALEQGDAFQEEHALVHQEADVPQEEAAHLLQIVGAGERIRAWPWAVFV